MQPEKHISFAKKIRLSLSLITFFMAMHSGAQVCTDPVNVIYGLTNAGTIHPIDVITGAAGTAINPAHPGNAPDQSNGIGYNPVNGKFYFFKRIPSSSIIEFVSFDPATNAYEVLSNPTTTSSVYSGSIAVDGLGYYCWDTQGTLFYYRISTNTWTTITTSIVDQFGKDVDSIIRLHSSGDGAIDGYGNLWILPSSDAMYGLFRLNGTLPTTAVASVTVQEVVAMTAPPAKFVGISFNSSGQIFMSTSSDLIYRLEDNLTLTLMSTLSLNISDLTSCNFPLAVLSSSDYNFNASVINGQVKLSWKPSRQPGSWVYTVERRAGNNNWIAIASGSELQYSVSKITYADASPLKGKNLYRIRIVSGGNQTLYTIIRSVDFILSPVSVWPNPVISNLFIRNENESAFVTIFNESGNKIKIIRLAPGLNNIDFKSLPKGQYYIMIRPAVGSCTSYKIIKK